MEVWGCRRVGVSAGWRLIIVLVLVLVLEFERPHWPLALPLTAIGFERPDRPLTLHYSYRRLDDSRKA